jgi:O-antigen/teichoic acid export membrane protein
MSVDSGSQTEIAALNMPAQLASPPATPRESRLKRLILKGAFWTIFGYGASQFLRLGGNLILTRLLNPDVFGLMALAHTAMAGLNMFSDLGTGASVVRNPRGEEPAFLNTAWTIQILRSCWLFLGACLLAWPTAYFYGDSRLLGLIPIVGVYSLISGFMSTSLPVLNRRMEVGSLARFELGNQIVGMIITCTIVWFWRSIWGMSVGILLGWIIRVLWSHCINVGCRNRLTWDRDSARELISFGRWIFLSSSASDFITGQTIHVNGGAGYH